MPAYLVELPATSGQTLIDGNNRFVVFAEDEDDAKDIVSDQYAGDSDALVDDATVTEIVAAADLEGFTFRVQINDPSTPVDVSYTAVAMDDIDAVGDALVVLLNATDEIANAAYDDMTQVLTVAGAADNLGDNQLFVTCTGPNGNAVIAGFVGAITDGGMEAAALTVALAADARVVPQVVASLKA